MNTSLKPTEQTTLQAFLLALSELDSPLPKDIQDEIHQIGSSLVQKDHQVINQIPELVKKYDSLNELYQKARFNLQQDYQTQERNKASDRSTLDSWQQKLSYLQMQLAITSDRSLKFQLEEMIKECETKVYEVAYSSDKLNFNNYDSGEIALDDIAASLFLADDFKQTAEQILQPFKKTSDFFLNLWKNTLSLAKAQTNLQTVSILKSIESIPFTTEDLTHRFDVPREKTINLIYKLWDEGKIDTLNGGIIGTIFPQLRKKEKPDLKDPLTLTSWGFFYLHPIFSIKK